jgi:predicted metal-dependent hydrolase
VQPDLPFQIEPEQPAAPAPGEFAWEDRIEFVRVRRARRYILRVRPDGSLRVTIPRAGSRAEATAFVARQIAWIARERARLRREQTPVRWTDGSIIRLDGNAVAIEIIHLAAGAVTRYGGRVVRVNNHADVRAEIERDMRQLARERLVPRLHELAAQYGLTISRVTIRNQRSRWGSCSRARAIALNFRLVQMPPEVRDYVLIHELMHLRQQNHGPRFWGLVEQACPSYRDAERWLRVHGRTLF